MYRIWAFVAGVPVGVLGALAAGGGSWLVLEGGALAGGAALLLAVSVAARFAGAETERSQLARAASAGLAALPAAAAAWLGLLPGAAYSLGAVLVALAACLGLAMRASGPGPGPLRQLGAAGAALGIGTAATLAAAGLLAAFTHPAVRDPTPEQRASYAYDVDASVALGPDPRCAPAVASSAELGKGASPALGEEGAVVWYDAPGPDGSRQLHRLERATGNVVCWTCGEPGNNRRPRVAPGGASVVFETDRYVTPFEPTNWELQLVATRGDKPKGSRRLTYDPAPDLFGSLDPSGRLLVWSSGNAGRYAIATAPLRSGHGGLLLGTPIRLVRRRRRVDRAARVVARRAHPRGAARRSARRAAELRVRSRHGPRGGALAARARRSWLRRSRATARGSRSRRRAPRRRRRRCLRRSASSWRASRRSPPRRARASAAPACASGRPSRASSRSCRSASSHPSATRRASRSSPTAAPSCSGNAVRRRPAWRSACCASRWSALRYVDSMPTIEGVRRALAAHRAEEREAEMRAAVAVVLRPGADGEAEVLLIERALKEGDPWSGHMAFPGGRQDPTDPAPRGTAERETLEEVGLDLAGAELLGRLDDLEGRQAGRAVGLVISAFVYHVPEPPPLVVCSEEVQSAFWVPLPQLRDPARQVAYHFRHELGPLDMPGIRVGDADPHVVWGLTYRFVEIFLALLGRPLPAGRPRTRCEPKGASPVDFPARFASAQPRRGSTARSAVKERHFMQVSGKMLLRNLVVGADDASGRAATRRLPSCSCGCSRSPTRPRSG